MRYVKEEFVVLDPGDEQPECGEMGVDNPDIGDDRDGDDMEVPIFPSYEWTWVDFINEHRRG